MEIKEIVNKAVEALKKYRYAVIVLLIGILLMCWPQDEQAEQMHITEETQQSQETDTASKLEVLLSKVSGAGEVRVYLSVAAGEMILYQEDTDSDTDKDGTSIRKETVIITDSDRNEQGLISQRIPETYRGAVILCQGADQPAVKLALVEAVSKVTGLGADQICVLKMK